VVIVCEGGVVRAFGSAGAFLWEYKAGGRLQPFIARSISGTSYVCGTTGMFLAINRSGRRLWQVNLREGLAAPPLIGWDDRIFVFLSKKVICFTASGTRLWQLDFENPLFLAPTPDKNGGFATVLENGAFIRVNQFGKTSSVQLDRLPFAVLFTSTGTDRASGLALYSDGKLEFIRDEADMAAVVLPAAPVAAVERGGLVAVLLANGVLSLVSPKSGVVWSVQTVLSTPDGKMNIDWDERGIYLFSRNGGESYNMDGKRLWNMDLRGSVTIPVIDENGVLYSSGKDWIFYAYRVEEQPKQPTGLNAVSYNLKAPGTYGLGEPSADMRGVYGENVMPADYLIETIENSIKRGDLGVMEPAYTNTLLLLAGGLRTVPENLTLRIRALRLLGRIGSRETIPFLAGLFLREQNAVIKSAAAEAIGAIGVDTDGRALDVFAYFITVPGKYSRERLLSSLAVSIGKLCLFSGPPLSNRGIPLLVSLTSPTQPKTVRRRAEQALSLLYNE
jgi:outer membrane protein assembly factor BamB